ncbi:MAG: Molybdenum ABC transporter (ATP-binding protein) [Candidatus Tokpelaia hoelldobleri]|uniref:Molybdenum ABC transporter (ATP-binding protein) n=1 Tax=Candidatus Tokpelaia hoelldobleri TaxID=1902579 RepID=A0A1U9JWS7_9HYPH|nr:MAG: Molybdenum ABC transporter (ATP-binding protein) [Candidatus Tokpelaia hoelldoblerii]
MTGTGVDIALSGRLGSFALDVAFHAPLRGVTVLYGASGCGKTTALRAIAGLTRLRGHVRVGETRWQDEGVFVPVHRRPIGYVFQEASLFPHLDVGGNLRFGMDGNMSQSAPAFGEVVSMLGMEHLVGRKVQYLSGGERQRVAIGRALLSSPHMLLMDEPLSALDEQGRDEIMPFLERLRDSLSLPVFYITHNRDEVERFADTLVCMDKGRVLASGSLEALQANPDLPFARARNAAVNLSARFSHGQDGLAALQVGEQLFYAPLETCPQTGHLRLRIAAGDVSLALQKPQQSSILNVLPGRIVSSSAVSNSEMLVLVALGEGGAGAQILSRISIFSWQALGLQAGMPVYAQIKGVALVAER